MNIPLKDMKSLVQEYYTLFNRAYDKYGSNTELEAKWIKDNKPGIKFGISRYIEQQLSRFPSVLSITEDTIVNNKRYTEDSDGVLTLTTKKRIKRFDMSNSIVLDLSYEDNKVIDSSYFSPIKWEETDTDEKEEAYKKLDKVLEGWTLKRKKRRTSYTYGNNTRIDLTTVNTMSSHDDNQKMTQTELEVEYIGKPSTGGMKEFMGAIQELSTMVTESNLVYMWNSWTSTDKTYKPNYNIMNNKVSTQPRNIGIDDLKYGGILPCKNESSKTRQDSVTYSITTKTDGVHKYIMFTTEGVWLVKPLRPKPMFRKISSKVFDKLVGTVVDGESLENHRDGSLDIIFTPFDLVSLKGDSNCQNLPHLSKRLDMAIRIMNSVPLSIEVAPKMFYDLGSTQDSMVKAISLAIEEEKRLNSEGVETDGHIFTPDNWPYKVISTADASKYGNNRTLVDTPDILKMKPFHLLTIDVFVRDGEIYVNDVSGNKTKLIVFEGTSMTPFTPDNIYLDFDLYEEQIIEIAPLTQPGEHPVVMGYYRTREDKDSPNSLFTSESVWKNLQQPITPEMVMGLEFTSMRRLFNKIKTYQISRMGQSYPKGVNLVDIGSGRGSDLSKIKKANTIKRIVAVEPNKNNSDEYRRRMSMMNLGNIESITLIDVGGEDTNGILDAMRDNFDPDLETVVMSMLSLSFFFSNDEMFDSLVRTLKAIKAFNKNRPTRFEFMSIEKSRLEKVLAGRSELQLGPVSIEVSEDETVTFDFPGTITGLQYEWKVDLDRLALALNSRLEIEDIPAGNQCGQYIMSKDEINYTSMYVTGRIMI